MILFLLVSPCMSYSYNCLEEKISEIKFFSYYAFCTLILHLFFSFSEKTVTFPGMSYPCKHTVLIRQLFIIGGDAARSKHSFFFLPTICFHGMILFIFIYWTYSTVFLTRGFTVGGGINSIPGLWHVSSPSHLLLSDVIPRWACKGDERNPDTVAFHSPLKVLYVSLSKTKYIFN